MGVHFYTAYPAAVKNLNLKVPPVAFLGLSLTSPGQWIYSSSLTQLAQINTWININIDGEMKIDFKE